MTSFFVENLKGYAQLRYFTHMDLEFLWWKGGKASSFLENKKRFGVGRNRGLWYDEIHHERANEEKHRRKKICTKF